MVAVYKLGERLHHQQHGLPYLFGRSDEDATAIERAKQAAALVIKERIWHAWLT